LTANNKGPEKGETEEVKKRTQTKKNEVEDVVGSSYARVEGEWHKYGFATKQEE